MLFIPPVPLDSGINHIAIVFRIENICAQKRTEISSLNQVSESKEIRSIRFIYFFRKGRTEPGFTLSY